MKKLVMTAVAIASVATIASAQTVTSANIVGYSKETTGVGSFNISAMQFVNETNDLSTVYGDSLPLGSKIYIWTGGGYNILEYNNFFVPIQGFVIKWSEDPVLEIGSGYWVETPSAAVAILSGEVPSVDSITNSLGAAFELVSYPYPVDRVITNLGFTPALGDKIYLWDGVGYDIIEYNNFFVPIQGFVIKWSDETAPVQVGEGFWYEAVAPMDWIVNKPF